MLEAEKRQLKNFVDDTFTNDVLSIVLVGIAIILLFIALYVALFVRSKGVKAALIAFMLLP